MGKKAPPRCEACKKAKHELCTEAGCYCHCMSESVSYRGKVAEVPATLGDISHPLTLMRNEHVLSRTTTAAMPQVVYSPKPSTLSDHLRSVMKEHQFDLVRVLQAWKSPLPWSRPCWTTGTVSTCYGCGRSCAAYDPLGHCRHTWCGWVGQKKETIKIVAAPMYPNMSTGSAVFKRT